MIVPMQFRVAAVLLWITGVGAGVFCLPAIRNLLIGRGILYVMDLPIFSTRVIRMRQIGWCRLRVILGQVSQQQMRPGP
jgi:hypothetical protein